MDNRDVEYSNKRLKGFAKALYVGMLMATLVVAIGSIAVGETRDLVLTLPIIVILAMTMFTDRHIVHIPPLIIMMMCATFFISVLGRFLVDGTVVMMIVNFLVGVNFGLLGLILVYMLLKSMPGVRNENQMMVLLFMMSVSVSMYILMRMLQYYIANVWTEIEGIGLNDLMNETLMVILGTAVVCIMYYEDDRHNLFKYTLGSFLEENSEALGLENRQKEDIQRLIRDGESNRLEFKSTLRTNLETGETDKRMEKAVLKTIVAFLNTDGGNLLIGVDDDGDIIGADIQSFENKDKMGLHLTNLIASKIGNSFLPFITFNLIDFDDKVVIRVKCDPCPMPVFYKDGKIEIFYVRSGPRTEELTGMTLISYIRNRESDKRMRKLMKRFKDVEPDISQRCDDSDGA
ncbi:MAG: hypothetical protein A3205_00700 [Methanomassiliicoccales archaeon Mx-03]|nr:MAG: hypothetical protein A3205_00700 [Methanomassiliicoccales archaeon Mx-03]